MHTHLELQMFEHIHILYNQIIIFSSTTFQNINCKDINKDHGIRRTHQASNLSMLNILLLLATRCVIPCCIC